MPVPGFEIAADVHGRDAGGMEPSGGTLTIDISSVSNGGWLPGDRDDIQEKIQMLRITATKNCWIAFDDAAASATSSDVLFLAGTESMKLPYGTGYVSSITFDPAETGKLSITVMN